MRQTPADRAARCARSAPWSRARRAGRAASCVATATLLGVLAAAPALALDDPAAGPAASTGVESGLDAVITDLRDELGETSEQMLRAVADVRRADSALPGARETAATARTLLATATRRQAEAARQRGQAQVRLVRSAQQAEASAAAVADQRARVGRLAREAYQSSSGGFTEMSILLEARSPADLAERLVSLQALASSQRTALDDLADVEASLGTRTQDLETVRDAMALADEQAQRELAAVTRLEVEARAAEQAVSRLVAVREAALAAARAAQAADDAAAARRDDTSGQLALLLAARARSVPEGTRDGAAVPAQRAALRWPVNGRFSSPFGMRVHPITGVTKLHTGQDIAAPCGTPVRAARAGEVVDAGWNAAYGYRVVVSHGEVGGVLLTTTYNHQLGLDVAVGDQVVTGEVIGRVGSTGYSTGCHLHFELYVNSSAVDPVPWSS